MKSLVIKASSIEEARDIAINKFSKELEVNPDDIIIKLNKKGFTFMKNTYLAKLHVEKPNEISLLKEIFDLDNKFILDLDKVSKYDLTSLKSSKDAEIEIKVTDNKMKATINYYPPKGNGLDLKKEEIYKKLKIKGIVFGIIQKNIKNIIQSNQIINNLLIAKGKEKVPGKDGKLEFHFERNNKSIGTARKDGSIDFHDLDIINNVKKGDKLVTRIKPEKGKPGKNIFGEKINPATPKKLTLPRGKNTEIVDDHILIASKEGHVTYQDDRVSVKEIFKVKGDVDFKTGNIDFVGSVFIEGNVNEGFEVKAKGDVHVRGNVEAAVIKSGSDVHINKNFLGKNKGVIKCDGDFKAKTVQNGKVICNGDIYVRDALMHSKIHSGGKIEMEGHKGLIVGGEIRATKEVNANIIGSSLATKTFVSAGIDPETRLKFNKTKQQLKNDKESILKTDKGINILRSIKEKLGKLPKEKYNMFLKLVDTKEKLQNRIDKNEKYIKNSGEKIKNITSGKIKAKRKIYPGVTLQIGNRKLEIKDVHSRALFKIKDGDIARLNL